MSRWNGVKSVTLVVALMMTSLTAANAETTFNDVKQQSQALIDVIGDYSHDRRVALVVASKVTLASIDMSINEMNTRIRDGWSQMNEAAKSNAQAVMNNLHQRRLTVAERLGALEQSSSNAWSDIRTGFSTSFADLKTAWENAKLEFDPS